MNKAVLVAAALVLAPMALWSQVPESKDSEAPAMREGGERTAPTERVEDQLQSAFKDRVAEAIETIEHACSADIDDFCGNVTSGGGRVALCMLAHEDQLSGRCRMALYRVARRLRRNVDRVAEQCQNEIQTLCGGAGRVGQCLEQKRDSLSSPCRMIVGALEQRGPVPLVGMSVYSSDHKNLGQIVDIVRGPDDKVQSIQVDIGRLLGLGTKVVTIKADKLEQMPRIKVLLSDAEVRSLPEAKKQ
jgi:hypothetical protein